MSILLIASAQTSLVSYVLSSSFAQSRLPIYVFKQQVEEKVIFLTQALRFVFSKRRIFKKRTFVMLSLIENKRFRKRYADSRDKLFIIAALRLLFVFRFITRDNGKRLKLIISTTFFEEICSERLQTVIAVSQHSIQKLIRRFENYKDFEKKL